MAGNKCPFYSSGTQFQGMVNCAGDECSLFVECEDGDGFCSLSLEGISSAFLDALNTFMEGDG